MTKKRMLRAVGRIVLASLLFVVRILPFPIAMVLGRRLGDLMRRLQKKRYRVALRNLRIAFGDSLTESERERIARESFRNFGMFVIEVMKFSFMSLEQADRRIYASPEKYAAFRAKMEHERNGCLFITAHLGNFELMGRWGSARGYEIIALMREARDQGTTELMSRLRERSGIQVVTLRQSLKPVLQGLKRNAAVAIVCDQNASDVFVPFFGHPTGTVDGPARIALKTGAPLMFVFCVRTGPGRYEMVGEGPYHANPTGDEEADIARVMTEVNRQIEAAIRKYPEQWLWFHDRWKSSPAVREIK